LSVQKLSLPPNLPLLNKIKVAAVSYLNTKPLLYGIRQHSVFNEINLIEGHPARVAHLLIAGEVDLGLIPVAVLPKLNEKFIVTDYCIGCNGPVASVCIFSDVPVWEIEKVYLDYQSRTSVQLAQLLLKEYWKKDVTFIDATAEEYRDRIKGTTAGVVIGDRALEQRRVSAYSYDLGEAWKKHTGLPFVFAAWVANKALQHGFLKKFNDANRYGIAHVDAVIKEMDYKAFDLNTYFKKCISYHFTEEKKKGMETFLKKLKMFL
jgi:chorismate dehydratase